MKICSDCKVMKPLTAFHKRRKSADGLAYRCADCVRAALTKWRAENPGAHKAWYAANRKRRGEDWQRWYASNREKRAASYKAWQKKNPHVKNAIIAKRNAAKKHATPAWADLDAIREFYKEAARLTKVTGIRHEVDHIIPLQGETVCGLHVENNLQILTRSQNARKKNRIESLALTGS